MDKRISSRAVIIENDMLITLFRRKIRDDGSVVEYYVIPGGGLEAGETLEENIIREVKEEVSLDVKVLGYVGKVEEENGIVHIFHCQKVGGIMALGGPEKERNVPNNYYEVRSLKLSQLHDVSINFIDMIEKAIKGEYIN